MGKRTRFTGLLQGSISLALLALCVACGQAPDGQNASGGDTAPVNPSLLGDVAFSTPSQTFRDQIQVGMTTTVDGAEIRYTVDGQPPTAASTLYTGEPLTLTATTQVRAQVFAGGAAAGAVSTGLYIARTIDATSDIPIMIVDGYGKGKPGDKEVYFDAAVMIWEPVNGVASIASLPTMAMRAGYHVRGQSSANFPQTPYKLELWDNEGKDLDYSVLGMPADSDWALIPPYYDRTLIRNPFTYALGREMGLQAPRTEFAEVYLNYEPHAIGEADYQGVYWVSETIKNNKVRTDLKQLEEEDRALPDISGGYIFKFDQAAAEEPQLTCTGSEPLPGFGGFGGGGWPGGGPGGPGGNDESGTCWIDLEVVDPDPLNDEQATWLTQYIQQFHDSLHQTPIGDYATYIDLPSFIDYLIISELTLNVDAYVRSAYYFKDRDQKLKAGPLWDYNFALGGVGAQNATPQSESDTGWRFSGQRNVNNWYQKLTGDPAFMAQVRTRYTALRQTLLSEAAIAQRMDSLSAPLAQAVVRDYAKWPVPSVIESSTGFVGGPTVPTWEGQLQVMRDFLLARLAWMDANLP
ncbi:CotH kinase family protein [Sorangium cellulosum]|uniref:Spore coat protein CotH n=1 Tax=Sorangium cellulosum TaxID=56 RepID=A0A150QXB2_SORCE|nr:CotH kinase family protein [Sorangium cellulosum]KYF72649.1 spore coat protein CotH [Sorangium cellulosum]